MRLLTSTTLNPYGLVPIGGGLDPSYSYVGRTGPITPNLVAGEHTTILVIFGDSLSTASDNSPYTPTSTTKVQDLSLDNGQLYLSTSPVLSGGGPGNDSTMGFWGHRLAQQLIDSGKTQRVIVACIGVNGTNTTQWTTGPFAVRIFSSWGRLNERDVLAADRIMILGSLGGWDQIQVTPTATVKANLTTIIGLFRIAGFLSAPMFLAGHSWANGTGGVNGTNVRAGISQAIAANANTYAGADTDTIPTSDRYDGNHLNTTGSIHAKDLWFDAIKGYFP